MKDQEKIEKILEQGGNSILLGSDVFVFSDKNSLKEVEACLNRLIEKHRDFMLLKKKEKIKAGYFG